MNPDLNLTQPYPFTKLRALLANSVLPPDLEHIPLSIGEPRHAAPKVALEALQNNFALLEKYPTIKGSAALREAIAAWLARRYGTPLDPESQILPVNGSREALFSFTQALIDHSKKPVVIMPSPFYQIYEGAAFLAGAEPYYVPATEANDFSLDLDALPKEVLERTQLVFVCSPNNPTGRVVTLPEWKRLFELSDRYGFVIGSDECYSEIYLDQPPLGALEAAKALGRDDFDKLIVFSSLSKRSNLPGMRSGFVAGDAKLLKPYLLYRTYHGCAMSGAVQQASIAAWSDEAHVEENRRLYREKFDVALPIIGNVLKVNRPDAGFYLWVNVNGDDTEYAKQLYEQKAITVLPGSFLGRGEGQTNPGSGYVRIALVAEPQQVREAALRIADFKFSGATK